MRPRKKLTLTLEHFRFAAQYMGALFVSLAYPRLAKNTWLLPGVYGPRAFLMLWTALLLALAVWMDGALIRASERDLREREEKLPGGRLNRSTLLALGVPALFLMDFAAIAHLYASYFKSGISVGGDSASVRTVIMAIGIVLWIYGRRLTSLHTGSVWGIRTRKTLSSPTAWDTVHKKATPIFLTVGTIALFFGTFFP